MKHSGGLYCYLVSCNGGSTFVATQVSLSNTCMNYFACSVHLSFVCCLVVTCFSVLLSVVLHANNSSTTVIFFVSSFCYASVLICCLKLLLCIKFGLWVLLCNGAS